MFKVSMRTENREITETFEEEYKAFGKFFEWSKQDIVGYHKVWVMDLQEGICIGRAEFDYDGLD